MSDHDTFFALALRLFGARSFYGLRTRFSPSPDRNYHYVADPRTGEITHIHIPAPDPNDVDQTGHLKPDSQSALQDAAARLIAGMAIHVALESTSGKQAARDAAIRRGADRPQNSAEEVMSVSLRSSGRRFEDTDLAMQRMAQAMHEETIAGIRAYLNGEEGNEVTEDLRREHGDNRNEAFRTGLQNQLAQEANPGNPDSGINPDQRAIAQFLDQNGYQSDSRTRAIATNPALRVLSRGLQRPVFEAAWKVLEELQQAAETRLGRKLTEAEVIELWQEQATNLSTIDLLRSLKSE